MSCGIDFTIDSLGQLKFDMLETLVRSWGVVSSIFFIGLGGVGGGGVEAHAGVHQYGGE